MLAARAARKERLRKQNLWYPSLFFPTHPFLSIFEDPEESADDETRNTWNIHSIHRILPSLEDGSSPQLPVQDLAIILQTCRRNRNLPLALRAHAYPQKIGLDAHASLGNYLIPMLVDVGCICDAQQVFDRLPHINEWSWDSLICGYVNDGKPKRALMLYQEMPKDVSVQLHGHTFVSLLRACTRLKDLKNGHNIHKEVTKRGLLRRDLFIGSALVDMYAKCSSLMQAQQIFDSMSVRDLVCWTTLIAGYAEHGHGREALYYLGQMQLQNLSPDAVTFVCALKACACIGATAKGEEVHVEIERQGLLESNLLVGNALVDMYAKCGLPAISQEVFDRLPVRDVVSWTALISGYTENGRGEESLERLEQMLIDGIFPNSITYVCILKACGSKGALGKGRQTHNGIEVLGLVEKDILLGNTLVDMYARCGSLPLAQEVFDRLTARNTASWATLIAGYTELGHSEQALELFDQMQLEGITPDDITFVCSLKACGSIGALDKGHEIHEEIERQGLRERNVVIGNTLVDMYVKCDSLVIAKQVFDQLSIRDVISWTALISGYAEIGNCEEALKCFEQMQLAGVAPNVVTYVCALKACSSARAADKGQEIHADIARHGPLERDLVVSNTLVDMYAKSGFLVIAQQVFDRLPVRTVVSWAALISGYTEHGLGEEAIKYFEQMLLEGFIPDDLMLVYSLKACCSIGATDMGQELHAEIERRGLLESALIGNTLITMYAKSGFLVKAQEVFDNLPVQSVVSWTVLMAGYAQIGESENVFNIFDRMLSEGLKPDPVTFLVILNACSRRGLFDVSQTYFEAMFKEHGMSPTLEHHICLVDLLVRAGQLGKAEAIIKQMPLSSNPAMWNTVLNSCKTWGNAEFAKQAFQHSVHSDKNHAVAYIAMSYIYVGTDLQTEN